MNQSFKVIWSTIRGCYVVVSELAKGSSARKTKRVRVANAVLAGVLAVGVMAAMPSEVDAANHNNGEAKKSVIIGGDENTTASGQNNQVIVGGQYNETRKKNAVIVGGEYNLSGEAANSTILGGQYNYATGTETAIIASKNSSTGSKGSVVIGGSNNHTFNNYSVIVGGANNYATQTGSVVLGGQDNYATGNNSIAFGKESHAGGDNSIAGFGGTTGTVNGTKSYQSYTYNTKTKKWEETTITVNEYSGGSGSIAIGKNSEATKNNVYAIGTNAKATASNTVALGNSANASVADGIALGSNSQASTAKGQVGYVPTTGTISNTSTSVWTSQLGAVSVGSSGKTRQITNVAAGTQDTDAVNVAQLKAAQVKVVAGTENVSIETSSSATGTIYTISVTGGTEKYTAGDNINISDDNVISATNTQNTVSAGSNITVTPSDNSDGTKNFEVAMKNDIAVNSLTVGGNTTINSSGVTIENGPSMTTNGIDMNNKKITNVADGTANSDAVNYGQLKQVQQATQDVAHDLSKLSNRVDKGIAGAAALAALHPMDFDPDDKLTFAAGLGNYKGENAGAVGMFFRPDEKVMLSLGATVGNSENIVNAGVSFSLDRTARNTNNKAAMAREILDMRAQMNQMASANAALVQQVNEMAAIINELKGNNALKPLAAENAVAGQEEARIRVEHIDTVDGYKLDEAHQIDRVHVVGDTKDENGNVIVKRDHYGNVVSQESK